MPPAASVSRTTFDGVLAALEKVKRSGQGQAIACCPAHEDRTPSLSVTDRGEGQSPLIYCHAGCTWDAVRVALVSLGAWHPPVGQPHAPIPVQAARPKPAPKRERWTPIEPPEGYRLNGVSHFDHGVPDVVYEYRNAQGNLLAAVCRFVNGPKALPYVYCKDSHGNEQWQWRGLPKPRPLYGLDLLARYPKRTVIIVEGEKCAGALNATTMPVVATTWQGGSAVPHHTAWDSLAGREVVLWPDADEPGVSAMLGKNTSKGYRKGVSDLLHGVAGRVRWLPPLMDKPKGWDAADAVAEGWDAAELVRWIRDHAEDVPPPPLDDDSAPPPTDDDAPPSEMALTPLLAGPSNADEHLQHCSGQGCHDVGNAARLIARHGADMMYVGNVGWHAWDGTRWKRDDSVARELAKATTARIGAEASLINSADVRAARLRWARSSQMRQRLDAMLEVASSDPAVLRDTSRLDTDPWALNCQNGTVDLRTSELRPHNRDDLITCITCCDYNSSAHSTLWHDMLSRVLGGDLDLMTFMRRAMGYSATALTREHVMFILYGHGSNGKTTFVEALTHVLGDYSQQAPSDMLMVRRNSGGVPNDIARLRGSRMVASCESDDGARLAEGLIKQMTGGDEMTARFLHKEFFSFKPTAKLWLSTNHRPIVRGTDLGIWRRLRLVPFTVTIPEEQRDGDLPAKLRAGAEGILAWIVAGAAEYAEHGLANAAAVDDATEEYRSDEDTLGEFLAECCHVSEGHSVMASDLRDAYEAHCKSVGISRTYSQKRVGQFLTERGMKRAKVRSGVRWDGLGLKCEPLKQKALEYMN